MAAASCARRSGERLSLFFVFLTEPGFSPAACAGDFSSTDVEGLAAGRGAVARAADLLATLSAFSASIASSLRLSLASFFGPSRRRFSSRLIFFHRFFNFMMRAPARDEGEFRVR